MVDDITQGKSEMPNKPAKAKLEKVDIAIYAVAILILALAAYYFIKLPSVPPVGPIGSSGTPANPADFYALLDRFGNRTNYTIVITERTIFNQTVKVIESSNSSYVGISTPIDTREYFGIGNATYTCIGTSAKLVCTGRQTQLGNVLKSYLLSQRANDSQGYRAIIEKGAANITLINATSCTGYVVDADFSKLALNDLPLFGISRTTNPAIYNYVETYCLTSGAVPDISSVKRVYLNPTLIGFDYTLRQIVSVAKAEPVEFTYAVDDSLYNETLLEMTDIAKAYLSCQAVINPDSCFRDAAAQLNEIGLCKFVKNATESEKCTLIMAEKLSDASACRQLGQTRDDCYYFIAHQLQKNDLCTNIGNESLKRACLDSVKTGIPYSECVIDSDCKLARSQQMCLPLNFADASWSGTFACASQTSCICRENLCSFNRTEGYLACVGNIEDLITTNITTIINASKVSGTTPINSTKISNSSAAGSNSSNFPQSNTTNTTN
ncbi:hypothetical protein COT30_03630 [Candidatus Micrarchaeota archaeon CG08_land_8_20_14_0_20_49_17]|nr:MAG: hypothetical protein AUJ13_06005 [Candidatus Micrarchaeota archaeon CG1_02_49_24]PIU09587.1 MAG: hypothetical protein COT30_03630 [Candidatus Micrarchaeota archaeon CG08_land_8_20_14_0_20_49_17]PIU81996.1 MAG: hypothetical protein COS70_02255 [Candidatus Micrarchaeota archaeon CG06_land_8_20_14_3_00_50_6]HII54187.1 hypothetical protein [Candidatus Micrarchaeota archaeon]